MGYAIVGHVCQLNKKYYRNHSTKTLIKMLNAVTL